MNHLRLRLWSSSCQVMLFGGPAATRRRDISGVCAALREVQTEAPGSSTAEVEAPGERTAENALNGTPDVKKIRPWCWVCRRCLYFPQGN
jgi:hypothetical protein